MSKKHPIISVTGSSGAGTTTVKSTFDQIFRREGIKSVSIEGDAFHRYNRADMKAELAARKAAGDETFSHFPYDANILDELDPCFAAMAKPERARPAIMYMTTKRPNAGAFHRASSRIGKSWSQARTCCSTRGCTVPLRPKA